jgi:hypothetical protein
MDIERLSKVQIVLLTLLVSFVTSIATGIVTVSLMNQAPPMVAQTVNRVIERTVQQVVPSQQPAAAAVTQEKTVIVNESDLISQAVSHASGSIVRLYTSSNNSPAFLGLGVIIDASGTIATDANALGESADAVAEFGGSSRVRAFVSSRDASTGLAFLSVATSTVDGKMPAIDPVTFSAQNPVLGETIISLAGKTVARIAGGLITSIIPDSYQMIDTSVAIDSILPGSPLIDTNGSLVGISTSVSRASSQSAFLPVSAIMQAVTPASGTKSQG